MIVLIAAITACTRNPRRASPVMLPVATEPPPPEPPDDPPLTHAGVEPAVRGDVKILDATGAPLGAIDFDLARDPVK